MKIIFLKPNLKFKGHKKDGMFPTTIRYGHLYHKGDMEPSHKQLIIRLLGFGFRFEYKRVKI